MSAQTLLIQMFRHKAWANEKLYAELAKVDAFEHASERHLSIRLLNHLFVVDSIFAGHLRGAAHGYKGTNTPETPEFADLRAQVAELDRWYVDYAASVDAQALEERLHFDFTDGQQACMSREETLAHVATHGSYHRGAVGRIMAQIGGPSLGDTLTAFLHQSEPERRLK